MSDLTCLNASQREAVTFGEGPLLLLAGPGSGKTFTITQRILYLIRERRITPEKLLVITFTREAALSMRQRFAQISPQEVHTVNFGTFHSVFYQILLQSGRISSGNILNDRQKRDLILPILKKITDCKKRSAAEVTELAGNYLAAIGYYKNTGDIENSRKKLPEEEKQHFSRIYEAYEEARKNTGGLDFEDILKECEEFLQRDPGQRTYWQNRFEYILIDEFQDINYRQYSIVKILAEKHRNIFAVGDDDQAIYGFRGARPACMRQFVEEFGAKQILLRTNYRSHPDIVEASLAVIDENKDRFHKDLEPCEAHRRQAGGHKTDAGYRKEYRVKIREFSEASNELAGTKLEKSDKWGDLCCIVPDKSGHAGRGGETYRGGDPFFHEREGEKHLRPFYRTGSSVLSADRAGVCYKSGLPEGEQQTISEYFQRGFWCRSIFTGFEEIL